MFKKLLKNKKGFTLVELMVVVGILGVLTAIAVPVYNNVATNASSTACAATRRSIESSYQIYRAAKNADTTTIKDIVDKGFLAKEPVCPDGGTYTLSNKGAVTCSKHPDAASSSSSSSSVG